MKRLLRNLLIVLCTTIIFATGTFLFNLWWNNLREGVYCYEVNTEAPYNWLEMPYMMHSPMVDCLDSLHGRQCNYLILVKSKLHPSLAYWALKYNHRIVNLERRPRYLFLSIAERRRNECDTHDETW